MSRTTKWKCESCPADAETAHDRDKENLPPGWLRTKLTDQDVCSDRCAERLAEKAKLVAVVEQAGRLIAERVHPSRLDPDQPWMLVLSLGSVETTIAQGVVGRPFEYGRVSRQKKRDVPLEVGTPTRVGPIALTLEVKGVDMEALEGLEKSGPTVTP